jgi:hypothetical protein
MVAFYCLAQEKLRAVMNEPAVQLTFIACSTSRYIDEYGTGTLKLDNLQGHFLHGIL